MTAEDLVKIEQMATSYNMTVISPGSEAQRLLQRAAAEVRGVRELRIAAGAVQPGKAGTRGQADRYWRALRSVAFGRD